MWSWWAGSAGRWGCRWWQRAAGWLCVADVVVVLQDVERVGGERRKVEHALLGLQVVAEGGWLAVCG